MTKKLKSILLVSLTLVLTLSSMGSITNLYAKEKEVCVIEEGYKPKKVTDLQIAVKNSTYIKLKWSKVKCATGYRIYRSTIKNGIYRGIGQVDEKTTCYLDKELECGTNYYYKVRAYSKVGNNICWGYYSDILDSTTCPCIVKYLHSVCVSDSSIQLYWDMVYKSCGYEVYRANIKDGKYVKVATIMDKGKICYIDKNLKSGKKYYYKVRAFKELNGQVCFGDCSNVLCVSTKK